MNTEEKYPFDPTALDLTTAIAQLKDVTAHRDTLEARVVTLVAENKALQGQTIAVAKRSVQLQDQLKDVRTDLESLASSWSDSHVTGASEVRFVVRTLLGHMKERAGA